MPPRRRSGATTESCSRTGPAIPSRSPPRSSRCGRCSGACPSSGSASATSCSRSPPATRPSSCRSVTAARTTRCSTSVPTRCSSRARTTASRSHPPRRRRPHTSRSTTAPSRASTFRSWPHARCSSIPRRGRARTTRGRCSASGSRRCRLPRRRDLRSICLIGSGPIVIGQACEFDYAGCQALKVLREDGFRTIVVNSNPATIMTDPGFADRTYLEPLDVEGVADVLGRERPDALLPTMGGQTALNIGLELAESGVLEALGVELIGAPPEVIRRAEDRELFRDTVREAGLKVPESLVATSLDDVPPALPFPVTLRPPPHHG